MKLVRDDRRLEALRRYNILDTEPEAAFDTVTELAADLFKVPIAGVSFIDASRQWFKSKVGDEERQIRLEHSFCVHAIQSEEVMVVEDLSEDERFADNPYVTEEGLRFYAGAPLVTPGGHSIGTLCLLDTAPRSAEPKGLREHLPKLASLVVDELELRRENDRRQQAAQRYETLFEEAGEAVLVHDVEGNILRANRKAHKLFGRVGEDLTRETLFDLHPHDALAVPREKLRALREGRDYHVVTEYVGGDGQRFWGSLTATMVEVGGEPVMRSLIQDVTERRRTERLQKTHAHLLEQIASGTPAKEVLSELARFVESELQQVAVSILTLENGRLYHAASPSLPEAFVQFIDGVEPGPAVGSCGTAAFTRDVVVTEDIRSDQRWVGYREAAAEAGLRSCWSYPIVGSEDALLGTFATYGYKPGRPSAWEKRLLHRVSHVASVALEKNRWQEDLQKSRQLLQLSQELASVGGWEYDIGTDTLHWTDETYRIHDLPVGTDVNLEEAIRFYDPVSRPTVRQAVTGLLEKGETYDLELRLITAEGDRRWIRSIGVPEKRGEESRRMRGAIQDITDQKETLQALQEQKALLRTLFDKAPVMIALFDEDGRPRLVNRQVEKQLGWSQEDVDSDPNVLDRLFPDPDYRGEALGLIQDTPEEWRELQALTKDGEQATIRVITSLLPDGRRIGIGVDITDQEEREKQLRLLEAAVEHTRLPILITEAKPMDEPGPRITYANPVFTDVTGYSREEVQGRSPRLLQGAGTDPEALARIRRALEAGEPVREIVRNYTKDGTPYWNDIYIAPVPDESGTITHYVSIQDDVTERVRRRQELERAKEEAEEAARLKSALLTNMNHEIRTPLTSIISFGEILASSPELADTFAERIVGGGKRLLRTLNTVMDFAELEAGNLSLTPVSVDVRDVARSVAGDFRGEADRKGLSLEVDTPDAPVRTRIDKHLVERIYVHLVSNAVKFTDSGSVTVGVRGRGAAEEEESLELWVEDTGMGMEADFLPRATEEFTQASTGNDRTHEGNGLGLAIVKRLADGMGGTLDIESEPGQGTIVTVRLPSMSET